jgi:hypothetical protein
MKGRRVSEGGDMTEESYGKWGMIILWRGSILEEDGISVAYCLVGGV